MNRAQGLSDSRTRSLFSQLISGVDYLHSKGLAHRDLKLENCFFNTEFTLKVADFGMIKFFDGPNAEELTTVCGSYPYMAPEVRRAEGKT